MFATLGRRSLALVVVGSILLGLALLVLSGGQVKTILSTVGASVGTGNEVTTDVSTGGGGPTATSAATSPGGGGRADPAALAPAPGVLIVRTGSLQVETNAVGAALDRASALVEAAGGYVAGSKTSGGSTALATLELRVPAAAWDSTLRDLRALGSVLDEAIGTEDVTGQVVDLDARVANLRATEAALQAIMTRATGIDDVLSVQKQLTETRGQIEELLGKAASLRDRAAFGSLKLVLSAPAAPRPTATPKPGWDPARDAAEATAKLVRVGQRATTAGIWVTIVGVPIIVALGVALLLARLAWLLARRAGWIGARNPA